MTHFPGEVVLGLAILPCDMQAGLAQPHQLGGL